MPADVRREGFLDVCRTHPEVEVQEFFCSPEHLEDLNYFPELKRFLDEDPDADGIFAGSDMIGIQLMSELGRRGRRVPQDVRIVGYDDVNLAQMTNPQLTTIRQPVEEMARECIRIIVKAAGGQSIPSRTMFPVSLERRGSTELADCIIK